MNDATAAPAPAAVAALDRRIVWLVLGAATLLAAALRLPFLDQQSLWLDEIYTRDILAEPSLSGLWQHVQDTESTPPLYYLIGWATGAHSAVEIRLIAALALIAAVPVAYLALWRWVGQRAALAAAAIVAVSPMLVAYSTNARSYGLLVLTGLLSVWALAGVLERGDARRFALWALACVACVWTHYFGAFTVAAELFVLLIALPQARRRAVAWSGVIAVGLIPLVPLVSRQSGDERAGFITDSGLPTRVTRTVREFAMGANVPAAWLEAAGLALLALAVAAGILLALRAGGRPRLLLLLAAAVVAPPLLLAGLQIEDRFTARNVMTAVPLVAALAAPALLRLRAAPLAAYLVLATVASVWVATDWRYGQIDWRSALARTEAIDRAAPVVAVAGVNGPVVRDYLGVRPAGPAGVRTRRAWLVVPPARGAGSRALGPVPAPAVPGFRGLRSLEVHGFTLVLLGADARAPITAANTPGATIFPARPPG